jgi:hypothetical protein
VSAWVLAAVIAVLNAILLWQTFAGQLAGLPLEIRGGNRDRGGNIFGLIAERIGAYPPLPYVQRM